MRILVLAVLAHLCFSVASQKYKIRACYFGEWAKYRPGQGKFLPSDIDLYSCTHLFFAFGMVQGNTVNPYEQGQEESWRQFTNLKIQNPQLKVILAIGGYNHPKPNFSVMASNAASRQQFAQSCIDTARYFRFDGIDIDWEYPGQVSPSDKDNFSLLIKDLSEAFKREAENTNRERLSLTAAVSAGIPRIQIAYNLVDLDRYLDFVNVMCYDYHGQWETRTGFASPLYAPDGDNLNVHSTIQYFLLNGVRPSKIVLGMASYARTFTLRTAGDFVPGGSAISGGTGGPFTKEPGALAYYEVCAYLLSGYTENFDATARTYYAYSGNQFITYDNPASISEKVDYLLKYDLAGAMLWAIDLDDFNDVCRGGRFPIARLLARLLTNVPLSNSDPVAPTPTTTTTTTTTTPTTTTTTPTTTTPTTTPKTTTTTTTPTTTPTTTTTTTTPTTTTPTTTTITTTTTTTTPTSTKKPEPVTTKAATGNNHKKFVCPNRTDAFYPHDEHCNMFYLCKLGVAFINTCRSGMNFSPRDNICVSDSDYSCS